MGFIWYRKHSIRLKIFSKNQRVLFQLPVDFEKKLAYLSLQGQCTLAFWILTTGFILNVVFTVIDLAEIFHW